LELRNKDRRWVDVKYIQATLSVSKTKAHHIAQQIAEENDDPEAVIKFDRCLRIAVDALRQWITDHGSPKT
jgi:hypothetical protein